MVISLDGFSQQINLNVDYVNTQIRSKRVELGLEINKGRNERFNGTIKIAFGSNTSSMTSYNVGTVSPNEDYNLKTY